MKVIIIGAGIAGLSSGILLTRQGHECHVYENAVEILPIGAAISLHSGGVRCINAMGFKDELDAMGGHLERMCYRDGATGEDLTNFPLDEVYQFAGTRTYPVSRAKLQAFLMQKYEEISGFKVQLGHQCVDASEENNIVTVTFANGTVVAGDLCIGADGVHSVIRKFIYQQLELTLPPRRYVGYVNFNTLVDAVPDWPHDQWTIYVGEGKRASLMPIDDNKFYCFLDVPMDSTDAIIPFPPNRDLFRPELDKAFATFPQPVKDLINAIDVNKLNRVPMHDMDPIIKAYNGRFVLVGDAKSVMTPDLGSAGALALEDCVYLARQLQVNSISLENALARYESVRLPRSHEFLKRCRERADMLHGTGDKSLTEEFYASLRHPDTTKNIIAGLKKNAIGGPLD